MKNSYKISIAILVVLAVILGFFLGSNARNYSQYTRASIVKIGYLPIVQGLPFYLAIEKGYFNDVGIRVDGIKFDAPNQIIDALISGQIDFASPGAATGIVGVAETKNPNHLRIFALTGGDDKVSNDSILVKKDSMIRSISELKGKKLGVLPGIQWRTIAQQILIQNGLIADKDVVVVELAAGLQVQALGTGQIDALLGVEPTPTIVKANSVGRELVAIPTVQYISDPFYGGAGVVNLKFAGQNPNTTSKVLDVFARAINEINQNPDSARQYLKNYTPLTGDLVAQVPISLFKMYNNFTAKDAIAVQKFYDIFLTFKVVEGKIDFQKLVYSPNTK